MSLVTFYFPSFIDVDPQNAGTVDYEKFLEISKHSFLIFMVFLWDSRLFLDV